MQMFCVFNLRVVQPNRKGSERLGGSSPGQPEPAGGQGVLPAHQRAAGKRQQDLRVQTRPPSSALSFVAQAQRPGPHPPPPHPPQQEQEGPQERPSAGAQRRENQRRSRGSASQSPAVRSRSRRHKPLRTEAQPGRTVQHQPPSAGRRRGTPQLQTQGPCPLAAPGSAAPTGALSAERAAQPAAGPRGEPAGEVQSLPVRHRCSEPEQQPPAGGLEPALLQPALPVRHPEAR